MARDSQFAKMKKKLKYKIRIRNRCRLCGRPRGYLRKFQMAMPTTGFSSMARE